MQLRQYIDQNNLTIAKFSEMIDCDVSTVHRYLQGKRTPATRMLTRIHEQTNGLVTANDFVGMVSVMQ